MDSVIGYGKNQLLDRWDSLVAPMRIEYLVWSPKGGKEGSAEPTCAGAGRFEGAAIMFSGSYGGKIGKVLTDVSTSDYHVLSFNFLLRSWQTSPPYITDPSNVRTGVLATLIPANAPSGRTTLTATLSDNGSIKIFLGGFDNASGGTQILSMGGVEIDVWAQIDIELFIHPTEGYVKLHRDGGLVSSILDVDTSSPLFDTVNPVTQFTLNQPATFIGRFDEIYLQDGSGTANNSYLGRVHIKPDVSRSLTDDSDFTGDVISISEGHPTIPPSRFALRVVDENTRTGHRDCIMIPDNTKGVHNGDETVMEATNVGQKLLINGPASDLIVCMQVSLNARKTSADSTQYKFISRAGGVDFELDEVVSAVNDYEIKTGIFNEDPRDGTAWDLTKLLDFDWGIKKV